ncbi:hypothetical protein ARAM_003754 [Aspergillus rambellii]|uniref:C6 finger domain protein n=1 Tax=Aspergillus rambellii TaxID=308745 RepID=A0A0F8WGM1_9EURO|nr:hypothetical protein ARAM_003754 [Aspergillus rambellii]
MPNTGKPSRACHACRERRAKVLTPRRIIATLRDPDVAAVYEEVIRALVIATSLIFAFARRGKGRGPRASSLAQHRPEGSRYLPPSEPPVLARSLVPEPWDAHFVPFAVSQFSFDQVNNIFGFIPRCIATTGEDSALFLACSAVGCAHLAHLSGSAGSVFYSARMYGRAIRAINSALEDADERISDSTLLGVWLLGLYEFLWGPQVDVLSGSVAAAWDVHCNGMLELIRLRGPQQFTTHAGRSLFWVVFNTVQYRDIICHRPSDRETLTWFDQLLQQSKPSELIILRTAIFSYHCIQLSSHIQGLLNKDDPDKLIMVAGSLMKEMNKIEMLHPYPPEHPIARFKIQEPLMPYSNAENPNTLQIGIRNFQCFFRMGVCKSMLQLLFHARRSPHCSPKHREAFLEYREKCIQELEALGYKIMFMFAKWLGLGTDTCVTQLKGFRQGNTSSSDFHWSDAVRFMLPLRSIAVCPFAQECHRQAAGRVLGLVKEELGFLREMAL